METITNAKEFIAVSKARLLRLDSAPGMKDDALFLRDSFLDILSVTEKMVAHGGHHQVEESAVLISAIIGFLTESEESFRRVRSFAREEAMRDAAELIVRKHNRR